MDTQASLQVVKSVVSLTYELENEVINQGRTLQDTQLSIDQLKSKVVDTKIAIKREEMISTLLDLRKSKKGEDVIQ